MVKKYPDGILSPSITARQIGQTLFLSNNVGGFIVEMFDRYSVIHMLADGTGLTAMLYIIQRALLRHTVSVFLPSSKVSIFFNTSRELIMENLIVCLSIFLNFVTL